MTPKEVARHLMLRSPQQMREWLAAEAAFESTFDAEDRKTYAAVQSALKAAAGGGGRRRRRRTMRGSGSKGGRGKGATRRRGR